MKIRIVIALVVSLCILQKVAFCEGIFVDTTAEEVQSVLCVLQQEGPGSVGHVTFSINPLPNNLGRIVYNGLFTHSRGSYSAIIHEIELTKVQPGLDGDYAFEGIDNTIGNGAVKGYFKNSKDFEVNGYFAKKEGAFECIYYRLTPYKSTWAKKVVKDNPHFNF